MYFKCKKRENFRGTSGYIAIRLDKSKSIIFLRVRGRFKTAGCVIRYNQVHCISQTEKRFIPYGPTP